VGILERPAAQNCDEGEEAQDNDDLWRRTTTICGGADDVDGEEAQDDVDGMRGSSGGGCARAASMGMRRSSGGGGLRAAVAVERTGVATRWSGRGRRRGGVDGRGVGLIWSGRGRRHGGADGGHSRVEQMGAYTGRGGAAGGGDAVERTSAGAVAVEWTVEGKNEYAEE
jgi:hypothetical protein